MDRNTIFCSYDSYSEDLDTAVEEFTGELEEKGWIEMMIHYHTASMTAYSRSGSKAVVADHFKVSVRDRYEQAFDKVDGGNVL